MNKYSESEILSKLPSLHNWHLKDGCLTKTFTFKDFSENFGFMARVALIAENTGHHPDWSGGYNKLTINLQTHDAGGITDKDFSFAETVEKLLK